MLLLIGAALCWSLGGVLIKNVPWSPLAVAGARGLIAAFTVGILCRRSLRIPDGRTVAAALAYAGCTITFVAATKMTTAANAILLQYTAPVYVAAFGATVLGEKTSRFDWVMIALTLGGMSLFFAEGLETQHLSGNLMAILSGVVFAAMTLLLRRQKDASPETSIVLGNVIAGLVGLPALLQAPALAPAGLGSLALLGVVQLGLSYYLYARAIRHVTALESLLIPVLEPILNPLWAGLLLGEIPGKVALLGGAIVVSCSLIRAVRSLRT